MSEHANDNSKNGRERPVECSCRDSRPRLLPAATATSGFGNRPGSSHDSYQGIALAIPEALSRSDALQGLDISLKLAVRRLQCLPPGLLDHCRVRLANAHPVLAGTM